MQIHTHTYTHTHTHSQMRSAFTDGRKGVVPNIPRVSRDERSESPTIPQHAA